MWLVISNQNSLFQSREEDLVTYPMTMPFTYPHIKAKSIVQSYKGYTRAQ